MTKQTT